MSKYLEWICRHFYAHEYMGKCRYIQLAFEPRFANFGKWCLDSEDLLALDDPWI